MRTVGAHALILQGVWIVLVSEAGNHPVKTQQAGVPRCIARCGPDLGEAVELGRVLGRLPVRLVLYAVEAGDVGYGEGLSPAVAAAADRVVDEIAGELVSG
jgi:hypothetical protein